MKPITNAEFHIGHLTAEVLRDIARNESAQPAWRKAAVQIMLEKGYKYTDHPDLYKMVQEIKAEREAKNEVEAVVESAIEAEIPPAPETHGALKAGVTAASLGYAQPEDVQSTGQTEEPNECPAEKPNLCPSQFYPIVFSCRHVVAVDSPSISDPAGLFAGLPPDEFGLRYWETPCKACDEA